MTKKYTPYKIWMNLRFKLGLINEQGDSIRRLKKLHIKVCKKIHCSNKMSFEMTHYNQAVQPEVCFCCKHYHKATKTKPEDYGWGWQKLEVKKKNGRRNRRTKI